jgi:AraC-like DNA-binding protein
MGIAIMLATALGGRAQENITLKLTDEPLPKALQLIEEQGGKSIIFSVSETEKHRVSADLDGITQAEAMNMSGSMLYRKMKSASSLSPNDYIRLYRLNTAARMLNDGCQIKIVVENVGFSSVSYFTSSFVKHFGITPGEYRNKSIKLK